MNLAQQLTEALRRRREHGSDDTDIGASNGTVADLVEAPSCGGGAIAPPLSIAAQALAAEQPATLTARQQRFVEEYLVDLNATQAAIRAGYSASTARSIGSENLSKPAIAEAIAAAQAGRSERTQVTADRVIQEFAKIGFGDLRDLFDEAGRLKLPSELSEAAAARIAQIEVVTRPVAGGEKGEVEYVHKIRTWDKVAALTQIGRHLGMFTDKMDAKVGLGLEALIAASLKPKD